MRPALCIQVAFLSIALIAMSSGCRSTPKAPEAPRLPSINGNITLDGANSVPDTAILAVRLVDLGRSETSRVVVEQLVSKPGAFPQKFRLYYNQPSIDLDRDYGIEALVTENGRPIWRQAQPAPVLTKGRAQVVELLLQRAQ
ncbi:MAG TPA: YbaY family lipoprotein [Opitutaceae bacterium]|nr:YbaY family lipoprotein [Opitutaceae bacterium]